MPQDFKPLNRLPAFAGTGREVVVVVETPRGSRNKYAYEENFAAFSLKSVLPEGTSFPYDFGFIPSTLGGDGDPIDALVLLDTAAFPGCVLTARLLGAIEAEQREGDGPWERNDRLVVVATQAPGHDHIRDLDDLRPRMLDEVEAFFEHYNRLKGKEFKLLGRGGAEKARALVENAARAFQARKA